MDATTASSIIAGPLGDVAGNFNFSKQAIARGEAIGLDVVSLYGAGRDFFFFFLAHLGAADDYAEATFAAVDSATLGAFTDAVGALVATVPWGSWPLFDGYRSAPRQRRRSPRGPTGPPSCCESCAAVCTSMR